MGTISDPAGPGALDATQTIFCARTVCGHPFSVRGLPAATVAVFPQPLGVRLRCGWTCSSTSPRGSTVGRATSKMPHWSRYQGSLLPPSPQEAKEQGSMGRVRADFLGKSCFESFSEALVSRLGAGGTWDLSPQHFAVLGGR